MLTEKPAEHLGLELIGNEREGDGCNGFMHRACSFSGRVTSVNVANRTSPCKDDVRLIP